MYENITQKVQPTPELRRSKRNQKIDGLDSNQDKFLEGLNETKGSNRKREHCKYPFVTLQFFMNTRL